MRCLLINLIPQQWTSSGTSHFFECAKTSDFLLFSRFLLRVVGNCTGRPDGRTVKCDDTTCIFPFQECDGFSDCLDKSDEKTCKEKPITTCWSCCKTEFLNPFPTLLFCTRILIVGFLTVKFFAWNWRKVVRFDNLVESNDPAGKILNNEAFFWNFLRCYLFSGGPNFWGVEIVVNCRPTEFRWRYLPNAL